MLITNNQLPALLVPSNHSLASQESIRLDQLCNDPFILTEAGLAQIVTSLFTMANLNPNVRFHSAQVMSTLALVARGKG